MAFRPVSLAVLVALFAVPGGRVAAQAPSDTTWPGIGLHLSFPTGLEPLRLPGAVVTPPRGEAGAIEIRHRFDTGLAELLVRQAALRRRQRLLATIYGGDSLAIDVGLPAEYQPAPNRGLLGSATSQVDLAIDGQLGLEISSERFQNLRCTAYQLQDPTSGCRPKFTAPRIDNTLILQASGVIGQRLHIDVDLDTKRDYTNSNTIRAYYQGLEDEKLQRVDVGTVQFRPPASRFLTAGIPINNFGVSAAMEFGPLSIEGLAATQKGSVVAERTYRVGDQTQSPQDRLVRDLDYETGRFYWVVDPATLPGYPRVDPLTLQSLQLPPGVRPAEVRVYRYRTATGNTGVNPNLGGISALARNAEGTTPQQVGPLRWELLTQGDQYWLDPSGTWFVLTAKLDPNDYLAVSYVTQDGQRVGTFPATDDPLVSDSLLLVVEPNRGPDAGTFRHAMRNAYRVAGSDLERASLNVAVLLNRAERPENEVATWLSRFGLAVPTDQAVFDTDNRLFPRTRDPGASEVIRDQFVVFPTLEPFGDPTLVTNAAARNDSLYRTPEYLLLSQGPPAKFQLHLTYLASGGGDKSSLDLNALQIRDGTEQIYLDGRRLTRGVDYSIAYNTGLVTFLEPEALFGSRGATVTARFEERGFFAVAPTSIFGLTARYKLGDVGGINLVGLYQSEATAFNRPPLGFEPTASLIGGISTDLRFDMPSVSRLMQRLVRGPMTARSSLALDAEVAFSRPDLNRSGEAYLEEFENDQGIPISLRENAWQYGSRPDSPSGVEQYGFAAGFDSTDAVQLIWQNLVPDGRGGVRELRPTDIDTNIVIRGGSTIGTETVMYMTFHADTAGGIVSFDNRSHWQQPRRDFAPRWRSMVTPLSLTGRDLSRNEYLEFWVFEGADRPIRDNDMRLMVDLGSVNEDALAIAPDSFRVEAGGDTTYLGRRYAGVGRLDTERSPTGTFNASTDDNGILGDRPPLLTPLGNIDTIATCRRQLGTAVEVFPWGDLGARCTAGNGVLDTEDLDADLLLNATGPDDNVFRYVVDLNDPKYFVRTGVQAVDPTDSTRYGGWRLYRIPLREVDRTIGQPNIRLVKDLRITFLTPPDNGQPDPVIRFALARMRLVGAPWIARADAPIVGLDGSTAQPRGEVTVTSVSTENIELGYQSPPGLGSSLNDLNAGQQGLGTQVNEKALRTIARDLRPGERAEAYNRFASGTQNLLAYREMRVWVRGRGDGWDDGRLRAFVKVGTDDENFYYYEAPAQTMSWQPEMVIDLEQWRQLRAEIETRFLRGDAPSGATECGGDPDAWVACDGGYVVHVKDPAIKPPNLAAVQEVATGIRYAGDGMSIAETELWTDDIRLAAPLSQVGIATAFSARLVAGDVGAMALSYVGEDGNFRQIGQAPTYRTTHTLTGSTSLNLGRFLDPGLGLVIPMSVSINRISVSPELITGSDVRGSELAGLRRPRSAVTAVTLSARRTLQDGSFWVRTFINPISLSGNLSTTTAVTEYSDADNRSWGVSMAWDKQLRGPSIPLGLSGMVSKLPHWLASSQAAKGIASGGFNPFPSQLRFQSDLSRSVGNVTSYTVPIERLADTILIPTENLTHLWRNSAAMSWRPLGMLSLGTNWQSTRDLRRYPDSTTLGRLVGQSRQTFLGLDAGVERDRSITSVVALTPQLASWLRPRATTTSNFALSRSLTSRNPVRVDGDTAGAYILPQTLNNARTNELGLTLEPAVLAQRIFGDTSGVARTLARVRPIDASWSHSYQSTFDLAAFQPGTGYQLALGGLGDYLEQEGVQAIGAADVHATRLGGSLDLLGLSADVRYSSTDADRYQRAAGGRFVVAQSRQRDWPDATLRWSRPFRGGPLTLVILSGRVRGRETRSTIPAADSAQPAAFTSSTSTGYSPLVEFYLRNGIHLRGDATLDRGDGINNGNQTQRRSDRWSASLEFSVKLPGPTEARRRPLRTSLLASSFHQDECLLQAGNAECITISDIRRTEYSLRLDTDVVGSVTGGIFVQYILQEYRHLDRRTSTLSLNLQMQVPLSTLGEL